LGLLGGGATWAPPTAELHEDTAGAGNMMAMQPLTTAIVPAGGSLAFKPLGRHVMLVGLKGKLVLGQHFPLLLHFEKAGDVTVTVTVARDAPALPPMAGMKM
jgi:copper(I)-binding protein